MNYNELTKKQKEDYNIIIESASFDENYYKLNYKISDDINPIVHYLKIGVLKGYDPSKYFDTKFYLKTYPDVSKAKINPFVHYLKYGRDAHRIPKGLTKTEIKKLKISPKNEMDYLTILSYGEFDEKYYSKKYRINKNMNPIVHYLEFGAFQGYNPSKNFDTQFYLKKYPDVKKAKINPFIHYLKYGRKGNRIPKED